MGSTAEGRANEAGTTQAALHAIPEHVVAPQDMGQGPVGNAELPEK